MYLQQREYQLAGDAPHNHYIAKINEQAGEEDQNAKIKEKDDEILVKDEKHEELMGIYIKAETSVHEARQGEKKAKQMVISL